MRFAKHICVLVVLLAFSSKGLSQDNVLQKKISFKVEKASVLTILSTIEAKAGVVFNYKSSILPHGKYSFSAQMEPLESVLNRMEKRFNLQATLVGEKSIILKKVLINKNITISGFVEESSSSEKVLDAYIFTSDLKYLTQSNNQGYFSLSIPKQDTISLIFSRVGYKRYVLKVIGSTDHRVTIKLLKEKVLMVNVKKHKKWSVLHGGTTTIKVKEAEDQPTLFGESDIMKTLQHYPGVQSVNEGISGLIVRGGTPDQNLVLLDGVPVYQASHLYGLYSIFNSDAIKKVSFTKSNFSVKNSSRLSSLIDVRSKEGSKKKLGAEGSVGLVSSKLMLEGPIIKDRTSFLVSARRTYIDLLGAPIFSLVNQDLKDFAASYYFYDINAKIDHKLSKDNNISLSMYHGVDRTKIKNSHKINTSNMDTKETDQQDLIWENTLLSLKYSKYLNKKWFGNMSLVYSNYAIKNNSMYEFTQESQGVEKNDLVSYNYQTGIRDYMFIGNVEYRPNVNHKVKLGFSNTIHNFTPGVTTIRSDLNNNKQVSVTGAKNEQALESRIYIEDDMKLNDKTYLSLGLNYSNFLVEDNNYNGLQYQLNFRKILGKDWIGHFAVGNSMQFLHFLPNSTIGLPTDIWLPSTKSIKPEEATQFALGAEYRKKVYSFMAEAYYKKFKNILEYKDGINFLGSSSDWESKVEAGSGESYGIEMRWAKEEGKTRGWIAYTLSWSTRNFDSINNGKSFYYRFDRRHDISCGLNHILTKRKSFGITWVFGSGNPTSIPIGRYPAYTGAHPSQDIYLYGERNNFRMRHFHRLDVVYNYKTKNKYGEGIWSFGLYNAYNRLNPFYITTGVNEDNENVFYQVSILPILPSISYKFSF